MSLSKLLLLNISLLLAGANLHSEDLAPAWAKLFPPRLYINEICIRPEKAGYPNWIELWNHTEQAINLNGWNIKTLEARFEIREEFVVAPDNLALILMYEGGVKSEEFERRLPDGCALVCFFGQNTFPYEYSPGKEWETGADDIGNIIMLFDKQNNTFTLAYWGSNVELDAYAHDLQSAMDKDLAILLSDMIGKPCVYPGCSMQLYTYDRFKLLNLGTSTPGRHYPSTFSCRPTVEVSFDSPGTPSYWNYPDAREKGRPVGMKGGPYENLGFIFLYVDPAGYNQDFDGRIGWTETVYELTYDEGFNFPVLREPERFTLGWTGSPSFGIWFSFEDYLYLADKTLYCRVGRKHIDGQILWSDPKSFAMPSIHQLRLQDRTGIERGISLSSIPDSKNEIFHQDDTEHLRKVNDMVKKITRVVKAIGVYSETDFNNKKPTGHLADLRFGKNLDGVYMRMLLHNFKCLKRIPRDRLILRTEEYFERLLPANDFSFLRGFDKLSLDLRDNDMPSLGGLSLVIKELAKHSKPRRLGLRNTSLEDLSPLLILDLEELDISDNTQSVIDLSPLAKMRSMKLLNIENLAKGKLESIDLSPLADCEALEEIKLTPGKCRNLQVLRKLPNLKTVNGLPVADFLRNNGIVNPTGLVGP